MFPRAHSSLSQPLTLRYHLAQPHCPMPVLCVPVAGWWDTLLGGSLVDEDNSSRFLFSLYPE